MLPLLRAHGAYEGGQVATSTAAHGRALAGTLPRLHGWVAEGALSLRGYATATPEFSTWSGRDFLYLDCLFVRDEIAGWASAHG